MTTSERERERILLLGLSRAGISVASALAAAGHQVIGQWNRSGARPDALAVPGAALLDTADSAPDAASLVIVAVVDDAIRETARLWSERAKPSPERLVVHLSGIHDAGELAPARDRGFAVGSLHPLRSYATPLTGADGLRDTWVAVEGGGRRLTDLITSAGGRPFSVERKTPYHLAASMASNLLCTLVGLAERQMTASGLDAPTARRLLADLARGTIDNIEARGPEEALTGPIVRGDATVVARHLEAVRGDAELERAYRALARATLALARRAGADGDGLQMIEAMLCSS